MKKPLHRLFTVFLMLAFSISGMVYFVLDIAQVQYKVVAGNHLAAKISLDIIKIPVQDLKSQAGTNELWHDGKLYDVRSCTIFGDTAVVSVFYDQDEERLVKSMVSGFETGNEYISDNGSHISKHKIHVPNDGKVLSIPYVLARIAFADEKCTATYFLYYASAVNTTVIKPPPQLS